MEVQSSPPLLRPLPKRPAGNKNMFHLTPSLDTASGDDNNNSPASDSPPSPTLSATASSNQRLLPNPPLPPQKTRSVLNLTASTLFGIYSGDPNESGLATPLGTGHQTPARSVSSDVVRRLEITTEDVQRKTDRAKARPRAGSRSIGKLQHTRPATRVEHALSVLLRVFALFAAGVAYGIVVTRLHESRSFAPIELQLTVDRGSWWYLGFWGLAGIVLGSLLPSIDRALAAEGDDDESAVRNDVFPNEKSSPQANTGSSNNDDSERRITYLGAEWHPLVRSVGAFVGIAFAIRRLPWQSTLQLSLTLTLVNPCLWYLIDRTRAGFWLSSFVGVAGAAVLLGTNPGIVPAPATGALGHHRLANGTVLGSGGTGSRMHGGGGDGAAGVMMLGGVFSYESVGVAAWMASVLFCSCVCFGNIGRRLALGSDGWLWRRRGGR